MDHMRAITIEQPGGPEVLRWTEVSDPVPTDDSIDSLLAQEVDRVARAALMRTSVAASPRRVPSVEMALG